MSAVVFDLDRTLVDLDVDIEQVRADVAAVFAPRGFTARFAPILPRIDEAARAIVTDPEDPDEVAGWIAAGRAVIDRAERDAAARARVRLGAPEVIAALAARGTPLGVVTDNGRACVDVALARLGVRPADVFAAIVTRDDVPAPKPDPSGLVRAALALLPRGGGLCYVGDSARDVETARAADLALTAAARTKASPAIRVCAVAVGGGMTDRETLAAAAPDALISDLREALDTLSL